MKIIFDLFFERLAHLGEVPLCNGMAERAPHLFGFCFPLCYRCTFFILALFITLGIGFHKRFKVKPIYLFLCILSLVIDGGLQTFFGFESTNIRRILTGGLFGFGIAGFILLIDSQLNKTFDL